MVLGWVVPLVGWLAAATPEAVGVVEKHAKQFNEERQFVVTVANLSQKAIVGYVMNIELLNAEGRLLDSVTGAGVSYDANVERKRPGEKWEVTVDARTSTPPQEVAADINIKVDYVLFADGTSSGPNTSGRGHLVRAEYAGARGERSRLRSILKEKGAEALIQVLQAEEWPRGRAN
jgi:hypothetical protein